MIGRVGTLDCAQTDTIRPPSRGDRAPPTLMKPAWRTWKTVLLQTTGEVGQGVRQAVLEEVWNELLWAAGRRVGVVVAPRWQWVLSSGELGSRDSKVFKTRTGMLEDQDTQGRDDMRRMTASPRSKMRTT